jgi:hypothetical protein
VRRPGIASSFPDSFLAIDGFDLLQCSRPLEQCSCLRCFDFGTRNVRGVILVVVGRNRIIFKPSDQMLLSWWFLFHTRKMFDEICVRQ